ncbi:MAG: hypothetical protein Q9M08_04170, partial [Mariprofundus sp.]|nr:hypothetical protein [Mariprofundus sp.]
PTHRSMSKKRKITLYQITRADRVGAALVALNGNSVQPLTEYRLSGFGRKQSFTCDRALWKLIVTLL